MKFLIIIISMVLVNNYPLAQFLGICPFLGVSKDLDSSTGMGIAVTFVMVLATAVTWPIQQLLNKFGIGYLQTVVFILVIAALVQLVEMFMKKSMPALYKSLGIFLSPWCLHYQHRFQLQLHRISGKRFRSRYRLPVRHGHHGRRPHQAC